MTNTTIKVSGLRKRFGPVLALDGMSFTVQPGQITGFIGPNGAGKSTTMRVILGLETDEGRAGRRAAVCAAAVPPPPSAPGPGGGTWNRSPR